MHSPQTCHDEIRLHHEYPHPAPVVACNVLCISYPHLAPPMVDVMYVYPHLAPGVACHVCIVYRDS